MCVLAILGVPLIQWLQYEEFFIGSLKVQCVTFNSRRCLHRPQFAGVSVAPPVPHWAFKMVPKQRNTGCSPQYQTFWLTTNKTDNLNRLDSDWPVNEAAALFGKVSGRFLSDSQSHSRTPLPAASSWQPQLLLLLSESSTSDLQEKPVERSIQVKGYLFIYR